MAGHQRPHLFASGEMVIQVDSKWAGRSLIFDALGLYCPGLSWSGVIGGSSKMSSVMSSLCVCVNTGGLCHSNCTGDNRGCLFACFTVFIGCALSRIWRFSAMAVGDINNSYSCPIVF